MVACKQVARADAVGLPTARMTAVYTPASTNLSGVDFSLFFANTAAKRSFSGAQPAQQPRPSTQAARRASSRALSGPAGCGEVLLWGRICPGPLCSPR